LILNIKSNINVLSSKKGTEDEFIKILLRSILEHLQLKTNVTTDLCGATTDEIISRLNHLSDDLGRNNSRSDVKDQVRHCERRSIERSTDPHLEDVQVCD
jgi:hypothetical protein